MRRLFTDEENVNLRLCKGEMFGMNNYITGAAIKALREKNCLTQQQLAEKLCVSDKAISKWETGVSLR